MTDVGGSWSCPKARFYVSDIEAWVCFIASGVGLSPLYCGHFWPIVQAPDNGWGWLWSNWWNEDWQGKPKYSEKTCPSATSSTTNPTLPDPGLNPGRCGGKPATNRLSYGAAYLGVSQFSVRLLSPTRIFIKYAYASSWCEARWPRNRGLRRLPTST
jgi:hypothetical protein